MAHHPERLVAALGEVAVGDERERVERILRVARDSLGMEIAYFSQFTTSEQIIHRVDGDAGPFGFDEGGAVPIDETFCKKMLDGEIAPAVGDARSEPALQAIDASVVGYIGVPLQLSTGRVYGTLCCASQTAQQLDERDVAFMRVLARLLADAIENPPPLAQDGHDAGRPDVRVEPDGQVARLSLWVVATPRAVESTRRALDCLAEWVPAERMGDLHLVASELVTNSVRHAGLDESSAVGIDVTVGPGRLRGHVTDPGRGFDAAAVPPPVPGRAGGWGLFLVEEMTEDWGVERRAHGGAEVWFEMTLAAAGDQPPLQPA